MPEAYSDPSLHGKNSDVIPGGTDPGTWPQLLEQAGYKTLAQTLRLLFTEFPEIAGDFNADRVNGWINELQGGGGRSEDDLRDDIFQYIVTPDLLMEKYGIDRSTAMDIIAGGNEGGINFSDFLKGSDAGGGVNTRPGGPDETDPGDDEGVGTPGNEDRPGLQIMTSQNMKWFFDNDLKKWYVGYTLPGSSRLAVFEAEPKDMDLLFGSGMRPTSYEQINLQSFLKDPMYTFAGDITEVEGTGQFEDQYHRMIALALDGGTLPEWAAKDGAAMDILFLAATEDKPTSWVIEQLSHTDSFKQRFPGLAKIQETANATLEQAIGGFLEMEAGVRQTLIGANLSPELATPEVIGALLNKGHSLTTVEQTVKVFDRMKKFAPAMEAFNGILSAQGMDPISTVPEMFSFMAGTAPTELYDIWEASTLSEQAKAVGLDRYFSADDAIQVALQTAGTLSTESVTAAMRKSAEFALRLRHELDMGKFGLNHEDLIDMNLGQPLRSGNDIAEVGANLQRVLAAAAAERQKQTQAFAGFSPTGVPQARSFGNLRQTS
jgi:hypothetical protein